MDDVVRFTLPNVVGSGNEVYVRDAGIFYNGHLDVPTEDADSVRAALQGYDYVEQKNTEYLDN